MKHQATLLAALLVILAAPACSHPHARAGAPSSSTHALMSPSGTSTLVLTDPRGDAFFASGYLDAVMAGVSKMKGSFTFSYQVAKRVPPHPTLPAGDRFIGWAFCIDTNIMTDPPGYPFLQGQREPCEFVVFRQWDGRRFTTVLVDRRPLLDQQKAVITPLAGRTSGTTTSMTLSSQRLDNPSSFYWHMASYEVSFVGSVSDVDQVPDDGLSNPASWSSGAASSPAAG